MTLNFLAHGSAIQAAYDRVVSSKTGDEWVIFDYEGNSNVIKVGDEGDCGLDEFSTSFNSGRLQYGVISVRLSPSVLPKLVLVHWQGEGVPSARVASTTAHAGDVRRHLKTVHVLVYARSEMDVEPDSVRREVGKLPATHTETQVDTSYSAPVVVGSVYTPVKPHLDISVKAREQFWDAANDEESRRKKDEVKVKAEDDKKWADDRVQLTNAIHEQKEQSDRARVATKISTAMERNNQSQDEPRRLVAGRLGIFENKDSKPATPISRSIAKTSVSSGREISNTTSISSTPHSMAPAASPVLSTNVPVAVPIEEINHSLPQYEEPPEFDINHQMSHSTIHEDLAVVTEGLRAVALWDYQAADDSEISFDPDDVITEIEKVDEGWWRGRSVSGKVGLFPANYVNLM